MTTAYFCLDEPGLTLHPMAQYDLIKFFESLSQTNQLLLFDAFAIYGEC